MTHTVSVEPFQQVSDLQPRGGTRNIDIWGLGMTDINRLRVLIECCPYLTALFTGRPTKCERWTKNWGSEGIGEWEIPLSFILHLHDGEFATE